MTPEDLPLLSAAHDCDGEESLFDLDFAFLSGQPSRGMGMVLDAEHKTRRREGPRGGRKPLRPRQQQLCELQEELEKQLQELKNAQEEGQRLRQRIKVLEIVLPIRERQALVLKQRCQTTHRSQGPDRAQALHQPLQLYPQQRHHAPYLEIKELHSSPSSDSSARSCADAPTIFPANAAAAWPPKSGPGPAHAAQPAAIATPYSAFLLLGSEPTRPAGWSAHAATAARGPPPAPTCPLPFSTLQNGTRAPTHMVETLMSTWNSWVREAGLVLHAHDARPHDPGPSMRLAHLRDQMLTKFSAMKLEYPQLFAEIMYVNMQTGERDDPPPDSFWVPVAEALKFTPEQVSDCRAALAVYQERIAKVLEERRALVHQLDAALAVAQPPAMPGLRGAVGRLGLGVTQCGQALLQVEDVTAQLYRNVKVEGQALDLVKDFLGSSLFSLVQAARASVLSYPYFPDAISLVATVVAISACPPAGGAAGASG